MFVPLGSDPFPKMLIARPILARNHAANPKTVRGPTPSLSGGRTGDGPGTELQHDKTLLTGIMVPVYDRDRLTQTGCAGAVHCPEVLCLMIRCICTLKAPVALCGWSPVAPSFGWLLCKEMCMGRSRRLVNAVLVLVLTCCGGSAAGQQGVESTPPPSAGPAPQTGASCPVVRTRRINQEAAQVRTAAGHGICGSSLRWMIRARRPGP